MNASFLNSSIPASACSPSSIKFPAPYGAELLSLEANLVPNYSRYVPVGYYSNHGAVNTTSVTFCNVTISYTHPRQNDTVNVQVWLPSDTWNGRLQMLGGSGWQAGLAPVQLVAMAGAIGEGYSTVSTDAGLGSQVYPTDWALLSPGNVNLYLLQDLASVSLNDAAVIGKGISKSYYGEAPKYSYFSGCSQGGRQGMMLAQRYPDAFDGIAASAPAINWNEFSMSEFWPGFVMDTLGAYPPSCEFDAITAAAIKACDGKDGVADGIISDEASCYFDPMTVVGTTINCTTLGTSRKISSGAVKIMQAVWEGPKKLDNSSVWYGFNKDAVVTGALTELSIAGTTCSSNGSCTRTSFELVEDWVKLFILKNASVDISNISHEEFDRIAHAAVQQYDSIIGTNDPDLSEFRSRGGKLISYHGLADSIIPPGGSKHYYDAVTALDCNVQDFYRLFFAPGLGHCFGGPGPYPDTTFDIMRKWVEQGIAPDSLNATTVGTTLILSRPLCPYPKTQYFNGKKFYCK